MSKDTAIPGTYSEAEIAQFKACLDASKRGFDAEDDADHYKFKFAAHDSFSVGSCMNETTVFFNAKSQCDYLNESQSDFGVSYRVVRLGPVFYILDDVTVRRLKLIQNWEK